MKMRREKSPYLTIYQPQFSSMYSILERISGILLFIVLIFMLLLFKLEVLLINDYSYYLFYYYLFKGSFGNVLFLTFYLFMVLNFSYHVVFGLRYVIWDIYGMEKLSVKGYADLSFNYVIMTVVYFTAIVSLLFV